jgi:hypothetical protein
MELKLDSKLYSKKAVAEAVEAFAELASISVGAEAERFIVSFSQIDPDYDTILVDEFANYALGLTIEGRDA